MARFLLALLLGLIVIVPASAAQAKKMILRWHGQSFFHLTTSTGTQIVFDPHAIEAYGRNSVRADLILCSHPHNDHTQTRVVENADKARLIIGWKGIAKRTDWNIVDEKVKDVRVQSVGVWHDNTQGMERGKSTIFIVEADGLRFCHLGDLGHILSDEQLKHIGPVDVLMIPVGGVYTINGSEAKKVVEQIKPKKYILPMHYGTKVFDDLLTEAEFLDEQKPDNVKRVAATNEMIVNSEFKPAEPVIMILHWRNERAVKDK